MKLLFQLLLLCIVFISVFGKRPSRNPKYEEAQGLAGETKAPYAKYDTVTITMHARDNITKQTWKSTYYPRVDEFTRLELVGTAEQGFTSNPNLTVWLEFPTYPNQTNLKDLPKRVYKHNVEDEENPVVVLYYTAIVLLDKGNIVDFKWDDGCGGCAKKLCIDEQCGAEIKKDNFCSEETNCNIKVYLVWMGRDKDDAKCRSISSRPNSFSKYSVTPITNFGNSLFSSTIFNFKSNAPNPLSDQA